MASTEKIREINPILKIIADQLENIYNSNVGLDPLLEEVYWAITGEAIDSLPF